MNFKDLATGHVLHFFSGETGSDLVWVSCPCGWSEPAMTQRAADEMGHDHMAATGEGGS